MHCGCSDMTCGHDTVAGVLETLLQCEALCKQMVYYVKGLPDFQARETQMRLLFDCAGICGLTANSITWNSMFSRQLAALCAEICEVCGRECARFPDSMSQHCAHMCLHCAMVCREFAGMPGGMPVMGM